MNSDKILYLILGVAVLLAGGASSYRYFVAPEGAFADVKLVGEDEAPAKPALPEPEAADEVAEGGASGEMEADTATAADPKPLPTVNRGGKGGKGPGGSRFVSVK